MNDRLIITFDKSQDDIPVLIVGRGGMEMKCMFQDCSLEAEKIVPCEIGMTGEHVDVHVCKAHYDLLFNKSVNVSMELKEESCHD